jgi:hypothetical protein
LSTFQEEYIPPTKSSRDEFLQTPPIIDLEKETQKSLQYVQSIKSTRRKLKFVHIPKAAGSTIEEVLGLQAKLAGGSCLFNHKPKRGVCKYPTGQFEWPMKIGYWHLPTQLFPLMETNPYQDAELFAVVRDPLDRLVSEFGYICKRKRNPKWWDAIECNQTRIFDPTYLNEWLQVKLANGTQSFSAETYLDQSGHYTPQYDFIVANGNVRMIDYVLRMEDLENEFAPLMHAFQISAILPEKKHNAARNDTRDLEVRHLDYKTMGIVRKRYANDLDFLMETRLPPPDQRGG